MWEKKRQRNSQAAEKSIQVPDKQTKTGSSSPIIKNGHVKNKTKQKQAQ